MDRPAVRWPDNFHPDNCPVYVTNEIDIQAPPERVWKWLIAATTWPNWYANSSDIELLDGSSTLHEGSEFKWRTFGVALETKVEEFITNERIAWRAQGLGVDAYHAWVITPTPDGCHVLTEETQHGWIAGLGDIFMPKRMHTRHQWWLEGMKKMAEGGSLP